MNQEPPRFEDRPSQAPTEVQPIPQPVRVPMPQSAPYVTYAIIGVTVVFYLLQLASEFLLQ